MKYLKRIPDFLNENKNNLDKVILECKEILMELVDYGFEVSVYESINNDISVNIHSKKVNDIIYSKIKPNVEHLLSYMSKDYNCELYSAGVYLGGGDLSYYESMEEVEEGNFMDHLCFLFKF